jgi:hypothetical protein
VGVDTGGLPKAPFDPGSVTPRLLLDFSALLFAFPGGENVNFILSFLLPGVASSSSISDWSTPSTSEGSTKVNSESGSANLTVDVLGVFSAAGSAATGGKEKSCAGDLAGGASGVVVLIVLCHWLEDRTDEAVAAVAAAVVVAVLGVVAATAACATEGITGKFIVKGPGPGMSRALALTLTAGAGRLIGSTGALSERDRASADALRAAATAIGRCLASSIGVCSSPRVSRMRFATEADA